MKEALEIINELSKKLPDVSFTEMSDYHKGYAQALQDIINSIKDKEEITLTSNKK